MKIELQKSWNHDGQKYPEGTVLDVTDDTFEWLENNGYGNEFSASSSIAKQQEAAAEKRFGRSSCDPFAKKAGFKSMAHFCYDVYRAGRDGRGATEALKKWSKWYHTKPTMQEADDEQGGYLVPTQFLATLLSNAQEAALIRPRATFIPMQTNRVEIPYVAESSRESTLFGGITIYRPAEGAQKTASKPKFGKVGLTLKKLIGLVDVTDELLEDSPISIEPMVNQMFGRALVFTEEEDFMNGTGVGQALGVINSPAVVSVAKEGGQAAATIVYANIVKMWSRLWPGSAGDAIWMANMGCFPQLATLNLAIGTGGSIAWMPSGGLSGKPYNTLMGRPLFLTEHCQALGTKGDIILADWSQYLIGGKAGSIISTASSMHLYFDYDKTVFRFVMRYDGQPWWASALTPKHGGAGASLSPFVSLTTRA